MQYLDEAETQKLLALVGEMVPASEDIARTGLRGHAGVMIEARYWLRALASRLTRPEKPKEPAP